ncbi:glycosyltransferase [Candidatus Saccharibacteria bacterium]|nr:glycosyltransferase [Candidatus Saccharibacteria bacterium]
MKILLVGGGSGGHITPLLAVASQLKKDKPNVQVAVITERLGVFNHLFDDADQIDSLYFINAGKFRRYHGEALHRKIFDIRTILLNIRDAFKLMVGTAESIWALMRIRPDVAFIKGGYVGVPVGLACRLFRTPYITHDSDAVPGLTNRIIGKGARYNAVGMPPDNYSYKKEKMVYVGVPVTDDFIDPEPSIRKSKRSELDLKKDDLLLLITGGSNGARRMDKIIHDCLEKILDKNPKLNIVHQVGKNNENIYEDYPLKLHSRIRVASFLQPLSSYVAAADIVIARAGATAIAEIGHMKKPLILVPNPYLTGAHQIKNAKVLQKLNAVLVIDEHKALEDSSLVSKAIYDLIKKPDLRNDLEEKLYSLTQKDATKKISNLLLKVIGENAG